MREDFGRWVVFAVLICFLGGILISHWKKQDKELKQEVVSVSLPKPKVLPESIIPKNEVVQEPAPVRVVEVVDQEIDLEGFYPQDPQLLKSKITALLKKASNKRVKGFLSGMVTPHAAMDYSGTVAANAFKQLQGRSYDTIVILVPNHEAVGVDGIVICPKGEWKTPLGAVNIDAELANRLKKESSEFILSAEPFQQEHALDVQLPFLQVVLKDFRILPVMIKGRSSERAMRLADALERASQGKKVLFLATTHLSRGDVYAKAKQVDFLATSALEQCDAETLRRYEKERVIRMCGYSPVLTLLYLMQNLGVEKGELLELTNSADVTGKKDEAIIGYASLAFYKKDKK